MFLAAVILFYFISLQTCEHAEIEHNEGEMK